VNYTREARSFSDSWVIDNHAVNAISDHRAGAAADTIASAIPWNIAFPGAAHFGAKWRNSLHPRFGRLATGSFTGA
jgi:hypothetical protein